MLSYLQSVLVVLGTVAVAMCLLRCLNRVFEDDTRKRSNNVNGWQLSILGSIYAVALGFMLSDAWLAYQTADADARNEAAASLTIYRASDLLPAACASQLQGAVQQYLREVESVEWPNMNAHDATFEATPIVRSMWQTVNRCDAHGDLLARGRVIDALETLQVRRDARIQDYDGHLPPMMWSVLLFGAFFVIASSCLLGNEKQGIHCFHVISLTVLISVMLLAISDLDRPFDGATSVSPQAFRTVLAEIGQTSGRRQ
jgi:hypothetical protein